MIKILKLTFVLTALVFISINTNSQDRIKFKKGEISAKVEDALTRGETYYYLVGASKDQFMTVTIMSIEDNAVFQIINKNTGEYLSGAEDGTDCRRWEGILPSAGDYKIIVGSTRGGSEYTLKVTIE